MRGFAGHRRIHRAFEGHQARRSLRHIQFGIVRRTGSGFPGQPVIGDGTRGLELVFPFPGLLIGHRGPVRLPGLLHRPEAGGSLPPALGLLPPSEGELGRHIGEGRAQQVVKGVAEVRVRFIGSVDLRLPQIAQVQLPRLSLGHGSLPLRCIWPVPAGRPLSWGLPPSPPA